MTQRRRSRMATFLVRLWMEGNDESDPTWRGQVEHVQSGEKQPVGEVAQVVTFIEDHLREQIARTKPGGIR